MNTLAERLCYRYHAALAELDESIEQPVFAQLPDKGAAWFAVANQVDRVLEPPQTDAPFEYVLKHEIEKWIDKHGDVVPEQIPTAVTIRPIVTRDFVVPPADAAEDFNAAIVAKVIGVELGMFAWRMSLVDTQTIQILLRQAGNFDASDLFEAAFIAAGGIPARDDDGAGWWAVTCEALVTEHEDFQLVRCRSPGVGTVRVGPIRHGHLSLYERTSAINGEWAGRIAALARACKLSTVDASTSAIECLRPEDSMLLWWAFEQLKKKRNVEAQLQIGQARSTRSTAGHPTTSTS